MTEPKLPIIFDDVQKELYLDLVAKGSLQCEAARAINFHPKQIRKAENEDLQFSEALEIAKAEYAEILEREVVERAMKGHKKTIYFQGIPCGTEIVHDNKLLMDLLKANNKDKFANKKEITGKDGGAIEFTFKGFDAPALPPEVLESVVAEAIDADFEELDEDGE